MNSTTWFQIQRNPKATLKKFQQVFSSREFKSPSWERPGGSTVTNHKAGWRGAFPTRAKPSGRADPGQSQRQDGQPTLQGPSGASISPMAKDWDKALQDGTWKTECLWLIWSLHITKLSKNYRLVKLGPNLTSRHPLRARKGLGFI